MGRPRERADHAEELRERGLQLIARLDAMADRLEADARVLREGTEELRGVVAELRDDRTIPAQPDGQEGDGCA